jgi:hypothetical protein
MTTERENQRANFRLAVVLGAGFDPEIDAIAEKFVAEHPELAAKLEAENSHPDTELCCELFDTYCLPFLS